MSDRVPTVERMLKIVEIVSSADAPLTPTEINRTLGLPKQSIHRLCHRLVSQGYLSRDVSGKRLCPSDRLRSIAFGLLSCDALSLTRRQILSSVSQHTGETVNFAVPTSDGMLYLDRVETDWVFRTQLPIGSQVPFHCTASGKCYLSSLSSRTRDSVLSTLDLHSWASNTLTDSASLARELLTIQDQGYAFDNEEFHQGMLALAVPIYDKSGKFVAALGVHGSTQRLSRDILLSYLDLLLESSLQLTNSSISL